MHLKKHSICLRDYKVAYRDDSCYCDVYHQRFVFGLDKTVFKEIFLVDWVATAAKKPSHLLRVPTQVEVLIVKLFRVL